MVQVAAVKQCDINPGDYRPVLRAASLIIFAFALFSYCMRLLSKFLYRSNWGADDTFMSFAAVGYSRVSNGVLMLTEKSSLLYHLLSFSCSVSSDHLSSERQSTKCGCQWYRMALASICAHSVASMWSLFSRYVLRHPGLVTVIHPSRCSSFNK